ncbi:Protein kinase domain-containing protein [Psidium guajava]|nr:Protein kinase domain-containing protein [Psidium guajava]
MVSEPFSKSSRSNTNPTPPSSELTAATVNPHIAAPNSTFNLYFGSPSTPGEKLAGQNYPIWKVQISPYLQAANLQILCNISHMNPTTPHWFLIQDTRHGETVTRLRWGGSSIHPPPLLSHN